jgi:hypothetical protein
MADNNRALDAKLCYGSQEEGRLLKWSPRAVPWALAITKARAVEGNEPVASPRVLQDPAGEKVFDHAAIAVQQDDGLS